MIQEAAMDLCLPISLLNEVFKQIYLLSYVRNTCISFLLTKVLLKAHKKNQDLIMIYQFLKVNFSGGQCLTSATYIKIIFIIPEEQKNRYKLFFFSKEYAWYLKKMREVTGDCNFLSLEFKSCMIKEHGRI